MATFGRRLTTLRQRIAAAPTAPAGTVTVTGTESPIGNVFATAALAIAQKAKEVARQQVGYTAPSRVETAVPPSPHMKWQLPPLCKPGQVPIMPFVGPATCRMPSTVTREQGMTAGGKGLKVPTVIANGIRAAEALPSQPGIGPAREGDSFWRQLMTTGMEKILGPATTPTRPSPQPGVYEDDFALAPPAGGMPGWVIPAALLGGFLLLRR